MNVDSARPGTRAHARYLHKYKNPTFSDSQQFLLTAAILVAVSGPASAGVIYDNGPDSKTIDSKNISGGFPVTDSFTLSAASVLSGVSFGDATVVGPTPASVNWAIGNSGFRTTSAAATPTR